MDSYRLPATIAPLVQKTCHLSIFVDSSKAERVNSNKEMTQQVDKDGDLNVERRKRRSRVEISLLYASNQVPLEWVGIQLWPASYLLAHFILEHGSNSLLWPLGSRILELGCGIGLLPIVSAYALSHSMEWFVATGKLMVFIDNDFQFK